MRLFLVASLIASQLACSGSSSQPTSLQENVGQAFATCNEDKIKFLASKHNVQLAFRPCGHNTFTAYRWAPSGLHLYFQLLMTPHVMDADAANKATRTIPTTTPVAAATWLTARQLAVPVQDPDAPDERIRLAIYDIPVRAELAVDGEEPAAVQTVAGTITHHPMPGFTEIGDTATGRAPHEFWFVGTRGEGRVGLWQLDTRTGEITQPLPWLTVTPQSMTYNRRQDILTVGVDDGIVLYHATDETEIERWPRAVRGSLHPEGRWLAVEYEGDAVSLYNQRPWDELSDKARARELRRTEKFEEGLPEWMPKEARPPTLGVIDRESATRWEFTAFLGDHFQWYEAFDGYASFRLWGYEGKQLKRNVGLTDLMSKLNAMDEQREALGIRKVTRDGQTVSEMSPPDETVQK